MKNSLKRFGAWGIALKNDPFIGARLKLTLLFAVSIIAIFFFSNVPLLKIWFGVDLSRFGTAGHLIALISVIVLSFWISARTLSPIKKILRAQKRFIADASHELRTPLAIMKTNSEITLLDGERMNLIEAAETLRSNLQEIDRMSKIIEQLLALSYYDNQFTEIPFQEINLSKLVTDIVEKAQSLARQKSLNMRLLNMDPGLIMGNPIALEQLAINLIKNAVTYTPAGGQISVSVTARNGLTRKTDTLEFKVKDTGIGIEKKDLPHVFSPFYKAGHSRVQLERDSSGLGLTIVKKIVERHRGYIYLNSAVDKGTTVIISIPRLQIN